MHATPLWNRSSYHFTRGTAVPIPIDQGNSSSYTSPRGTAVPSNSPGKQWFLYQFTKGTVVPTNSPKEQWFLQLHQRNSGSYIHCGNSGSCIFAKGATFPTNSQWNSGSHERGIAVSKKFTRGTEVPTSSTPPSMWLLPACSRNNDSCVLVQLLDRCSHNLI